MSIVPDPLQSPASHTCGVSAGSRPGVAEGVPDFERFERELHEHLMNLER